MFLILLGILVSSGSLATAYLDSRDFLSALYADRSSERIGLGIQGVQLFHYLATGITISALGGGLLAAKRSEKNPFDSISLDSHGPVAFSHGTMKRLEAAMDSISKGEKEPDTAPETMTVKTPSSRKGSTRPSLTSRNTEYRSTDSLINRASLLLTNERQTRPELSNAGAGAEN